MELFKLVQENIYDDSKTESNYFFTDKILAHIICTYKHIASELCIYYYTVEVKRIELDDKEVEKIKSKIITEINYDTLLKLFNLAEKSELEKGYGVSLETLINRSIQGMLQRVD